jgi:hypothetical protein
MDLFESRTGVDVEAGHHNNNPPLRSSITKMVAEPAGTCIMDLMINENPTPSEDQVLDAYWLALAERFETDSADIGSEFDS